MHHRQRSPRGFYRHHGGGGGGVGGGDFGFGRGYNNRRGSASAPFVAAAAVPNAGGVGIGVGVGDIFVEAGRLAAEYLVSQGMLPPSVLSLKLYNQNGSFKKHVGVDGGVGVGIGIGGGVGEISVDGGRPSALARLGNTGNAVPVPVVDGRRKLGFEEFGQKSIGRRRGSFNSSNGFDWGNRDYRRNGSWSDRFRGGSGIRDEDGVDGGIGIGSGSGSGVREQDEKDEHRQQREEVEVVVGGGSGGGGGVDNVTHKSSSNEFVPTSGDGKELEAEIDKTQVSDVELLELKQSNSVEGKDTCDMDVGFVASSKDLESMSGSEVKEVVKDGTVSGDDGDKPTNSKNSSSQSSDQENNSSSMVSTDLLLLCKSVKVPTKTRSSLTNKISKALTHVNNGEGNVHEIEDLQEPEVLVGNESIKASSSGDLPSDKTYDIVHIDSDTPKVEPEPVHSAGDTEELVDTACEDEEDQSIGSQSVKEQDSTAELPEYGDCSSMSEERGEKRVAEEDSDVREDTKRLKEWKPVPSSIPKTEEDGNVREEAKRLREWKPVPSLIPKTEEDGNVREDAKRLREWKPVPSLIPKIEQDGNIREDAKRLREWKPVPSPIPKTEEYGNVREDAKGLRDWKPVPSLMPKTEAYFLRNTPIEVKEEEDEISISHVVGKVSMASDQGNLMSSSQFTVNGDIPFFQCSEEKPQVPSSFRTCDLNLIEASEVHDNHIDHPILIYSPHVPETNEAVPVDIDLSKSHASVSGKFTSPNGKEIEVIDLESDSFPEEKPINSIERKTETLFTGLEGFSTHAQNAADIHDVQDGYGLMISELLETDFATCSSVPDDINSVHGEIGLHNGTGTLAEDDSIYMSLGELSFLRPWEQPPSQDFQKHF